MSDLDWLHAWSGGRGTGDMVSKARRFGMRIVDVGGEG